MAVRAALPFDRQCQLSGLPVPVAEHKFHEVRRWRFDWAWPDRKVALEVEGGVFQKGGSRHSRGAGYRNDIEKYNAAAALGWRIVRALPEQIAGGQALAAAEAALKG
jgi:hypothetical protein